MSRAWREAVTGQTGAVSRFGLSCGYRERILKLLASSKLLIAAPPPSKECCMSHYKSNLRDVEFNLFELFNRQDILGTGPFEEVDADTAKSILGEIERISREDLAAS